MATNGMRSRLSSKLLHAPEAPAIVLLHGIQGTAKTWDAIAPQVPPRYHVIAPNLRGRADAYVPDESSEYQLEKFASDLLSVINEAGPTPIVVAWSMGVSVVLALLEEQPDLSLSGLILVGGSACVGSEARWFSGDSLPEVAREASERSKRLALIEAAAPHAVAASWMAVKRKDLRHVLSTVQCPTLIIHGVDDDQCPIEHGRLMQRQIPSATMQEWPDTGHNPMASNPIRFAQTVVEFADSLRAY
ncbi:MAG: alpha/beta hydrolase [Candidimonas sp.]|nr:MAG: alpha/beta hydrolase [Candidimonas sp.]TAM26758.1 MAG: alpha/beta hydrolase [Candidimonas sp.]